MSIAGGLVSLIMPAWRPNPEWLNQAVASALGQEHAAVEVVVVDDGSPEPAAALLKPIKDPRLRVVRIEHGGVSYARNAGVAEARGEWIRFIDADDVLPPLSTSALLMAASPSARIVYGSTLLCDQELQPLRTIKCSLEGDVVIPCLLEQFDATLPAILFGRDIIDEVGPWNEAMSLMEDYDFVLRAVEHARVKAIEEIVYCYRYHPESASNSLDTCDGEIARRTVIARFFERHPDLAGSALHRRARSDMLLEYAREYAQGGSVKRALSRLAQAARHDPWAAAKASASVVRQLAVKGLLRKSR